MATEAQINTIADIILQVFENDPSKFQTFLEGGALDADVRIARSQLQKIQNDANIAEYTANQAISDQAAIVQAAEDAVAAFDEGLIP